MLLLHSFLERVADCSPERPPQERALFFEDWLKEVTIKDLADECERQANADLTALGRRLTQNPPSVLEMGYAHGYGLQLLYWFPIESIAAYGSYDTEDIHSHFGPIVTKALVGNPYVAKHYLRLGNEFIRAAGESEFKCGDVYTIWAEDIHSVKHQDGRVGISLRVVLPYTTSYMDVFDSKTLKLKERIWCASEQKMAELAGLLSSIDPSRFLRHTDKISEGMLSPDGKHSLERQLSLIAR